MSLGNTIRHKKINKALKPLETMLLEENSSSSKFIYDTIKLHLRKKVQKVFGATFPDHAHQTLTYFSNNLGEKVEEAISATTTAKEARAYLIRMIKSIEVIEVESYSEEIKEQFKQSRGNTWHILKDRT